jgi:hypothetical protein
MMMMMMMMIPSKGVFLRVQAARENGCVPVSMCSLKGSGAGHSQTREE